MNDPKLTDLVQTSLAKERVRTTVDDYLSIYDEGGGGSEELKKRYGSMIKSYYDLVTDFYEYGWGQSFHFAPRSRRESFEASLTRHEIFLALRLGLRPGMKVLDVGCGVGGPMRTIARFSGATILGVNNNEYQVTRGVAHTRKAGLSHLCSFVNADFMDLPLKDGTCDAAIAIEAACHAPDRNRFLSNLARAMKPGALFGGYEWCLTPKYDADDPEHREIKRGIEGAGTAVPEVVSCVSVLHALRRAGFEVIESGDRALESDPETPWYSPLATRLSFRGFKRTCAGRALTMAAVRLLEIVRVAPPGCTAVSSFLNDGARALVRGGQTGIFTPMFYFLARKPG
jgi:sterol 24-C-methyltransferase